MHTMAATEENRVQDVGIFTVNLILCNGSGMKLILTATEDNVHLDHNRINFDFQGRAIQT